MKERFSRQPFSSSVARICSRLRTSTQSPALRFRFLDGFKLFPRGIAFLRHSILILIVGGATVGRAESQTLYRRRRALRWARMAENNGADAGSSWSEWFEEYGNPDNTLGTPEEARSRPLSRRLRVLHSGRLDDFVLRNKTSRSSVTMHLRQQTRKNPGIARVPTITSRL